MSDEKPELDLDAQAILARRKKLLAVAAISLAVACEVRQEPIKTSNDPLSPPSEQPKYCLSVFIEPEPKSEPASQTQPAETQPTVVTPPVIRPPCLKPPPTICLKKRKCLSYKKPKICLSEF
jgi:hypothetical protein